MGKVNRFWIVVSAVAALCLVSAGAADKPPVTRAQALKFITQASAQERLAGVTRLAEIGTMADADLLVPVLRDGNAQVRFVATAAMWQIWSRSGDAAIDGLYQRGMEQLESSRLEEALAIFTEIIQRKPSFAEGWNKRATLHYLMGNFELSLKDCDEVIKRNRNHFGALSGYGQIYLNLGDQEKALQYFEKALAVNPNLPGAAVTIRQLQEQLREKRRKTI
ncbi:MAG: tetratricopeptide repeat protein [Rhodoferax sp.]|nr:tetratricopeptide repeat protein [Rhodoferax sp.]